VPADSSGIRRSTLSMLGTGVAAALVVVVLAFASGGYLPASYGVLLLAFARLALTSVLVVDDLALDRRTLAFAGGLAGLALWSLASWRWSAAAAWPVLEAERGLLYATAVAALAFVLTRERIPSLVAGSSTAWSTFEEGALVQAAIFRFEPGGRLRRHRRWLDCAHHRGREPRSVPRSPDSPLCT
jgi:hypothetical protein